MIVMPQRIVLDTRVLYAGLFSKNGASYAILDAIERGGLRIVLSTPLVFEYEEVLRRNQEVLGLSDRALEDVLDDLCARGESHSVYFLWRPHLPDPEDDHLLELAVASGARMIVTHNMKHFPNLAPFDVQAVTPKTMLEKLK